MQSSPFDDRHLDALTTTGAIRSYNPEAAYAMIVTLIRRARNLTRAIGSRALLDVYGRVARLLLDNAVEENGTFVVGERMTQQEVAKRVGASREMVSRIVTDLRGRLHRDRERSDGDLPAPA